jgi:8-oxo-dGTP pyrophosphatase MutT (NUDIX family)
VADVRTALERRGEPPPRPPADIPLVSLPGPARPPAAVLCLLFDWEFQCHLVLTRRSSQLRSHAHQVAFPGGRLDRGESASAAALREAQEEVGIDPGTVEIIGRLAALRTVLNPAPITPLVGAVARRPHLVPNPAEVERAFDVPLVELLDPGVYREELWTFPSGEERSMAFFELVGDTVWGATASMLIELLDLTVAYLTE